MTRYASQRYPIRASFTDLLAIVTQWRVWFIMGNQDIKLRYKRSLLGPFWISVSLTAMIVGIGYLYSEIFKQPWKEYTVFLTAGMIAWIFIATALSELTTMVTDETHHLRAVRLPMPVIAARIVYRNFIILMHNLAVGAIVVFVTGHSVSLGTLWLIPGILGLCVFLILMGLVIAPMATRYRDLPEMVRNFLSLMFFLTPIFWAPGMAGRKAFFVDANPFTALVDLIRAPLLDQGFPVQSLTMLGGISLFAIIVGLISLASTRNKIYNWL